MTRKIPGFRDEDPQRSHHRAGEVSHESTDESRDLMKGGMTKGRRESGTVKKPADESLSTRENLKLMRSRIENHNRARGAASMWSRKGGNGKSLEYADSDYGQSRTSSDSEESLDAINKRVSREKSNESTESSLSQAQIELLTRRRTASYDQAMDLGIKSRENSYPSYGASRTPSESGDESNYSPMPSYRPKREQLSESTEDFRSRERSTESTEGSPSTSESKQLMMTRIGGHGRAGAKSPKYSDSGNGQSRKSSRSKDESNSNIIPSYGRQKLMRSEVRGYGQAGDIGTKSQEYFEYDFDAGQSRISRYSPPNGRARKIGTRSPEYNDSDSDNGQTRISRSGERGYGRTRDIGTKSPEYLHDESDTRQISRSRVRGYGWENDTKLPQKDDCDTGPSRTSSKSRDKSNSNSVPSYRQQQLIVRNLKSSRMRRAGKIGTNLPENADCDNGPSRKSSKSKDKSNCLVPRYRPRRARNSSIESPNGSNSELRDMMKSKLSLR